jgi:hypothetical protein
MKRILSNSYEFLKTRMFTASIFFTLAVIVFGAVTYIQLPCPICDGKGEISGVSGVDIVGLDYELVHHEVVGLECGWDFERYTYDVEVSVENNTQNPLYGLIEVTFHDPDSTRIIEVEVDDEVEEQVEVAGMVIAAETIFIEELDAGGERTVLESILFDGISLEQIGAEVHLVEAHTAHIFICPFHGESNKVSLTDWLNLR